MQETDNYSTIVLKAKIVLCSAVNIHIEEVITGSTCTAEGASKRQPSPFTLLGNRRFLTLIHAI